MSAQEPYPCPKGTPGCMHTGCRGHNRAGGPCGAQPVRGTAERPRCRSHLGTTIARVHAHHEAQLTAQALYDEAQRTAADAGAPQAADVMAAILEVNADALMWHRVCRTMVGELREVRYRAGSAGEQLDARVALFERSMERVAALGERLVRLGIDDRMAKISERQNAAVALAIEDALRELAPALGIDAADTDVRAVLAKHLRGVTI